MSLRFELEALLWRCCNAINPVYRQKLARLRRMYGVSINLGSGGRGLPGWINIDIRPTHADQFISHDIRRSLPFADGRVRRIFAEHVVEHLDFRHDVPATFADFWRVLEPGGTLRIVVPDAARFLCAYATRSRAEFRALGWDLERLPDIQTPMQVINHIYHQEGEHYFGWDFETLEWVLRRAGFREVLQQRFGLSRDPELAIDRAVHAPYSLYVEAVK